MFLFLKKNKLNVKNKLKYENKIVMDNIILLKSEINRLSKLFVDRNPPEDIMVRDRLKASKFLKLINLNSKKITNVIKAYKIIIFNDCFVISEELKDM
tara:strand:+ start:32 stop:325 length:294 start_codon:yes stop_codon:yes gene_type:complete